MSATTVALSLSPSPAGRFRVVLLTLCVIVVAAALAAAAEDTKNPTTCPRLVCARLFFPRRAHARVSVFSRAVDDDPSTNRSARSGITPPSILGSRHFLPRTAATAFPLRRRNGFFLSMITDAAAVAPVPVLRRVRPAHIAPVFRSLRPAIRETTGLL